jgi:hypothetical protein
VELDYVRRLTREAVPSTFEKCLNDHALNGWKDNIQSDILEATQALIDLLTTRLRLHLAQLSAGAMSLADDQEAEDDLLPLLSAVALAFKPKSVFHEHNQDKDLPQKIAEHPTEWAVPNNIAILQAAPTDSGNATSSGDDGSGCEQHIWLAHLVNHFGVRGGFDLVCEVRLHFRGLQPLYLLWSCRHCLKSPCRATV